MRAVHVTDVKDTGGAVKKASEIALLYKIAKKTDRLVLTAGVPFGTPGSTNLLHVVTLTGDELERHQG